LETKDYPDESSNIKEALLKRFGFEGGCDFLIGKAGFGLFRYSLSFLNENILFHSRSLCVRRYSMIKELGKEVG